MLVRLALACLSLFTQHAGAYGRGRAWNGVELGVARGLGLADVGKRLMGICRGGEAAMGGRWGE